MNRIILILLLLHSVASAGDSMLFWKFGEMSNRVLIYTDDDVITTGIPTSIFLVGLISCGIGFLWIILTWFQSSIWHRFIGLAFILGTMGASAFSWLFEFIGVSCFGSYSVKLFWSWACTGALIGAGMFVVVTFVFFNSIKKRKEETSLT